MELEPTRESPSRARHAVSTLRERLDEQTFADLELLVSELVTNAVRHARLNQGDVIRLDVEESDERVRVEVVDDGVGFVPRTPRPAADGVSGWGLYIAERVADRWGVNTADGTTRVWAEWDLGRRSP